MLDPGSGEPGAASCRTASASRMVPGTAAWSLKLGLGRSSPGRIDGPERSPEPKAIGCRPARRRALSEISAAGRREIARLPHAHRAGRDQLDLEIGPRHVQFVVPCPQQHVREQPASFADARLHR